MDRDSPQRKRARLFSLAENDEAVGMSFLSSNKKTMEARERPAKNPPKAFLCPLTMDVMYDPVLDAEGNTYERSALSTWLKDNHTSPVSRQPLTEKMVTPNKALREAIFQHMGTKWIERKKLEHSSPKTTSPFRQRIDEFLQSISGLDELGLQLNEEGFCAFQYLDMTIIIDVPENMGVFSLVTKDMISDDDISPSKKSELYKTALSLNFLQGETHGGCLSVRPRNVGKEIVFTYTDRVSEVSPKDFSNIIFNFAETSFDLKCKLMATVLDSGVAIVSDDSGRDWEEEEDCDFEDIFAEDYHDTVAEEEKDCQMESDN